MTIFNLKKKIDRVVDFEGKNYRYFSGTSYLGMAMLPEFQEKVVEGLLRYGLNHGQSRGNNVRLAVYNEFEDFFSNSSQAESAIVMSSGYLAGTAALQGLTQEKVEICVAPDTHPAILPLNFRPNPREGFEDWKLACLEKSEQLTSQKILILGNAVDPLSSQIHDYTWLKAIGEKHDLTLLIDDSHAFGILGEGIFGTYASLKNLPARVVVSGSLGKALNLPAGIILCDAALKVKINQLRIFGGASPCPPGYLQAFIESQELYSQQRRTLSINLEYFYKKTEKVYELTGNSDYPVFIYSEEAWVEKLERSGFITSSFPYPTTKDPRINRIVVSGFHWKEDLDLLSKKLVDLSTLKE